MVAFADWHTRLSPCYTFTTFNTTFADWHTRLSPCYTFTTFNTTFADWHTRLHAHAPTVLALLSCGDASLITSKLLGGGGSLNASSTTAGSPGSPARGLLAGLLAHLASDPPGRALQVDPLLGFGARHTHTHTHARSLPVCRTADRLSQTGV